MVSNIPKQDRIFNRCSYFPRMNYPYLESLKQLDRLFPSSLHKIKFHIFNNVYKYWIHRLRPFKYKNTCELCDIIQDKYKRVRMISKKCFVLHEEVIYVFHEKNYIPTIEKLSFNLAHVSILGSTECGKTSN